MGSSAPGWSDVARRLLAYGLRLGASVEEAEDVVQEALLVAVRDPSWHDARRAQLVTVLARVVKNRLIDRWRHRSVKERYAGRLRLIQDTDAFVAPDQPMALQDARSARRALLAGLRPEERAVFRAWLRQRGGELDGPGAAETLGLSYSAYEAAKKRLRRRCRAILAELGLDAADLFDEGVGGGR